MWLRLNTPRCSRRLRARGEVLAEATAEASLDRRCSNSLLLRSRVRLIRHRITSYLLRPMHQW